MNKLLEEDIEYVASRMLPWEKLKDKSVLVSGATGMIGSFLVTVLMHKNYTENLNCKVYILGRNREKAKERFNEYWDQKLFCFIEHDICESLNCMNDENVDYILHLASNTHPVAYATDPIGTITLNVLGTKNLLDFACRHNTTRFLFASSNEIYGENRGDVEFFDEQYCGYLDCNTMRAGYPESKRCGETLCQAYWKQKNVDIVIPRLTRSYGPTMLMSDTKAISQFIKNGINKEDIILKSKGEQYYSYTYVADAVFGLLTVLLKGKTGKAYNIADQKGDMKLKDLARVIADYVGTKVVFESPDEMEKAGYSTATKARLDGTKLKQLGWTAKYDIEIGLKRTIDILGALY